MRNLGLLTGIVMMILTACDGKVYDTYRHTSLEGWERNDTLCYDVTKMAQAGDYLVELGLRTDYDFPFVAITLIVRPDHSARRHHAERYTRLPTGEDQQHAENGRHKLL